MLQFCADEVVGWLNGLLVEWLNSRQVVILNGAPASVSRNQDGVKNPFLA